MHNTFIYTLKDPRTNQIRYVGKTDHITKRLNEHIRKAVHSHTHKNHWILSLKQEGLKPILEIIDIVPANECGFWEEYWIGTVKSWGFKLTNIAKGGIGGNLGDSVNNKISEKLKNRIFSETTINKMKVAAQNRQLSIEGRKSLSFHRMGEKNSMYGKPKAESAKHYRKITQLNINSKEIKEWKGIIIASKALGINRCTISDVCNGRKLTAGGYKWRYVD